MSDIGSEYFSGNTICRDTFDLLVGERLGRGVGREVFACALSPELVLKFEVKGKSFQNALEWEVWQTFQYAPKLAKWLAPCVAISACGSVLVQKRTYPLRESALPRSVPSWLSDLKPDNWGELDGLPVCHDYGYPHGLIAWKPGMQKTGWGRKP